MNEPLSIVLCMPANGELFDPNPDETAKRDVRLTSEWEPDTRGVVGWSAGGWQALRLAAEHPDLQRLVIVSLPFPEMMPSHFDPEMVTAKTLLLYGSADPLTGNRHGTQWQKALPNARLEMKPGGHHDLLVPMWSRVLSYLAPRRRAV